MKSRGPEPYVSEEAQVPENPAYLWFLVHQSFPTFSPAGSRDCSIPALSFCILSSSPKPFINPPNPSPSQHEAFEDMLLKTETPVCLWHHRALMCRQGPVPSSPVQCRPSPVMPAGQASQPFPGMQDTFEKHDSSQRFLECSQKRPKVSPSHLQLVT